MSSPAASSRPTGSPPVPTDNGSGNGNGNGNTSPGSASLYLYTFLATLVLLLVVSAAIVVRSFMLRRRHRMMIEEAFRNGTIPPTFAPFGSRPRVDLSKKPKMWDAWIEANPDQPSTGGRSREKEWYWDMIKPFSAVYTVPPPGAGTNEDGPTNTRRGPFISRPSLRDTLMHYVVAARPSAPSPPTADPADQSEAQLAMTALSYLDSGNASLKVAVLIAMPRKSPSHKTSPSSLSTSAQTASSSIDDDDEEPLPHLEMGVTEVRVVPSADEPDANLEGKKSLTIE